MAHPIHLFDLPTDVLAEITHPAYIGQSSQYVMSIVCKQATDVIHRPAGSPCDLAAHDGQLEILDWAINVGYIPTEQTCAEAAAQGDLHILKYLHVMAKCPWDVRTTTAAAGGGHTWTLDYAVNNGCEWTPNMLIAAAENGHLEIFEYVEENRQSDWMLRVAIEDDNYDEDLDIGEYLLDLTDIIAMSVASIKHDHFHITKWLTRYGCDIIITHMETNAVKYGRINVLELLTRGVQLKIEWWHTAVLHDQIQVLDWLYLGGCPGRQLVRETAVKHNKQLALAWADSKGL